ncbi:MAG: MTH938/NDUFAF3 family protein [Anaerolineae bacterium]
MTAANKIYMQDPAGPIERMAWAMFTIDGQRHGWDDEAGQEVGVGKDIRVRDHQVTAWRERKGHHLSADMVTGVCDPPVKTLIIGTGVYGRIKVRKQVIKALTKLGIEEVIVEPTPQACQTYNALVRQGCDVALLAHGTC